MRRRVLLVVLVVSLVAGAAVPAAAIADEALVFDQVMTWRHDDPEGFNGRVDGPRNWAAPVNYKDGALMFRLEVVSKPSDRPLYAQVCLGQQDWRIESCSRLFDPLFRGPGVYTTNLGAPSNWWSHGAVDWSNVGGSAFPSFALSDPASDRLMQTQGCGAYCWDPRFGDIDSHMPIAVRATLVAVSAGSSFSGWQNYVGGEPGPPPDERPNPTPREVAQCSSLFWDDPDATNRDCVIEVERGAFNGWARVISDSNGSSGGAAIAYSSGEGFWNDVATTETVRRIRVRARSEQCHGGGSMQLWALGEYLGQVNNLSAEYRDYEFSLSSPKPPGDVDYWIELQNDRYDGGDCDRNLIADKVTLLR